VTDLQVQDRVAGNGGQSEHGATQRAPAAANPPTQVAIRRSSPSTFSGRSLIRLVELAVIVTLACLTLDFVFHATGALNVGVAGVAYSTGSFLAAPFVGILRTTAATPGNLFVWTDLVAMGVYAAAAIVLSILVAKVAGSVVKRTA